MRWLSARQFGVIALANITYAPMTALTQQMIDVIADHDALPSRPSIDTTLIELLGERLVALLSDWDDQVADALFTDNVGLDEPYDRRQAEARRWLEACGGTFRIERVDATSRTSGRVALAHPGGTPLWLDLQIAPLHPPRLQHYDFELEMAS